mmetsp:Transcript_2452/g.10535  ORF Transcript_2452/g.10535 Transcript_2452/m.10535 type:complete len:112 (+) Transcript_2452:1627-1962(+)
MPTRWLKYQRSEKINSPGKLMDLDERDMISSRCSLEDALRRDMREHVLDAGTASNDMHQSSCSFSPEILSPACNTLPMRFPHIYLCQVSCFYVASIHLFCSQLGMNTVNIA